MRMRHALFLVPFLSIAACSASQADDSDDEQIEALNFQGGWVAEYTVSTSVNVTLEANLANATPEKKLARAKELVRLKNIQVSWFLNAFLAHKEDEQSNANYGGFAALTRFGSEADAVPEAVDATTYRFKYKVTIGGTRTLIDSLPGRKLAGVKTFPLSVGKLSNQDLAKLEYNHEWYREAPWDTFDPKAVPAGQVEQLQMTIAAEPKTSDAYLAYDRLFADGELTIAVHYGWDYAQRTDISSSRKLFDSLVKAGYKAPAGNYAAYDASKMGPLTKTITSNGKPVVVKFSIFHPGDASQGVPGPDPDTDAGGKELERQMRESFAKREVVIFKGHSGPLYGFALANWRVTNEGDLDDSKIPGLEMPSTYQIVFANGCETYAMGEAFWKNPAKKDQKSLNLITTTNFANLSTDSAVDTLIAALTNQKSGKVVPSTISALTNGMDKGQGWGFNTMFGVHGVDANPKYDPMADTSKLCKPCSGAAGDGDRCTKLPSGARVWSYDCLDDSGCPANYNCRAITSVSTGDLKAKRCLPKTLKCE